MTAGQAPELALIHGWGIGSAVWQPLCEALSRCCRVHLVDLPGYGGRVAGDADFTQTARSLVEHLPDPVILCGWSLGAMLAARAALLAPQRVCGLILVGATASFTQRTDWPEAQPAALLDSFSAGVQERPEQTLQRFAALLNQGDGRARTLTRMLLASLRSQAIAPMTVLRRGLDWLREVDLRPLLPSLRTRSLLIHGEKDPLNPLAAASWVAANIAQARLEVFADAGHAPFLADPDRFVRLVEEFCHADAAR